MNSPHFDFIIIGTGADGGTLAYHLAPSRKKILLLSSNRITRFDRVVLSGDAIGPKC
jgi:choline dehydrogenase-like flavoprotein